jgi:CoA:oxalate CoA-transferase
MVTAQGGVMTGPLSDINVLDVSRVLSGPFCTMMLRDLGAQVVKVESPGRGDMARRLGPMVGDAAAYFMSVNRGKLSITLDIFDERGQELFRSLADQADVVVENYVPGTMERLGLDQARLRRTNPKLVYASISGFGQTGPYAQLPALDIIVQAMGGIMSVTGEPNSPPIRPGVSLGDSVAGLFTALSIVSALHQRERTGTGQYIDTSMLDCQVTLMENALARYFASGEVPGPLGSRHPAASPFQSFATSDGHIVVAMLTDDPEAWRRFCDAVGRHELSDDQRYADNESRVANHHLLEPALAELFAARPSGQWLERLQAASIPCAPVNTVAQMAADPQVTHRGMVAEIPHPQLGTWRVANTPFNFSDAAAGAQGPSPMLGEHTEEVLRRWLGLTPAEVRKLRGDGAI